jgi:FKBP-type peptidyl-prolyl cis-trans isomerase FklB
MKMKKTSPVLLAAIAVATMGLSACGRQNSVMDEIDKQDKADAATLAKKDAENETFLAANKAKAGVTQTASGLQYEVIRAGDTSAPPPGPRDAVNVMYEGKLTDGAVFDSAYQRGEPIQFGVDGVIPGWTEALQLMHPGSEFRLVIPPNIGYGPQGQPPDIPAESVLVFKVELLGYRTASGKIVGKFPK